MAYSPNRSNYGVLSITASTSLTFAEHVGKCLVLNAAAGLTLTLPDATGSGEEFDVYVGTTVTSNDYIIQVPDADNVMTGFAIMHEQDSNATISHDTAATSDTLTMDGGDRGGFAGAKVKLRDIAADTWFVEYVSSATAYAEASPFSAAVS